MTENLIKKRTFVLYCEYDEKKKTITVTENGLQFPMRNSNVFIPYICITQVKCYRFWPHLCGCEDLIHIGTSDKHYYFSGRKASKLEKAISEEMPEVETLL